MTSPPGAKVLLVDDEPANLLALQAVLEEIGATLVCAGSGRDALRLTQDNDFAAILLDVRMPGMDGFEVARLIRSRPRSRTTPILFVTAGDSTDLASEEAYSLGAVDFLTKPLRPAMLKAKVSFFIELYTSREELRTAERQAVNERAFMAAVLETIEDGIVACGPDGVLTLFNRATRELHGLPEERLPPEQWSSHYALYRNDGKTPLPPDEIPLLRALRGETVRDAEMVVAPRGARPRSLVANGQALYDGAGRKLGAVVSMHDVTARREAEAARDSVRREKERRRDAESAAQANAKFRTFFEQGSYFAALVALDGTVLESNRLMLESGGLIRRDVVGRKFWECGWWRGSADAAETVRKASIQAAAGVPFHRELPFFTADGQQRSLDLIIAPVTDEHGKVLFVAPSGVDTTERNRAAAALQALAAELSASDRRKTEFLATLAHELRNPLAPLRSGLHVMRMANGDAATLERTRDMMDRQVTHMVRLIDDLLDVARISSGKVELKKALVPLQSVVDSAVETCQPLFQAGGHQLLLALPQQPLRLHADPTRLAQVLGNLLNNAAKYTPAGGEIRLAAVAEGAQVAISITDSGIGIPADDLPELFHMFTQVGRSMERSQGGLGIGLSLVRALVDLHGGSVTAQSAGPGQGSVFTVRLPLAIVQEAPAAGAHDPAPPPASHSFRVLVVDDNRDAAETLAMILEMNGHKIRVANDGDQAIGVAGEFRPQVVFLDIGMPGKNGYDVARELRQSQAASQAVLVALTGWGADADRARSRDAGFDHHLTKPAEMATVERLLAQLPRPTA